MNNLIKYVCISAFLFLLENCSRSSANSAHRIQEGCDYSKINHIVLPDSSTFFINGYNSFRGKTKTGILYYSCSPSVDGSKQMLMMSFTRDNVYLIKNNNGVKDSMRINKHDELQIFDYLRDSKSGLFYQDCNIIQNHSKIHFICIRVDGVDRSIYTSFYGSPLKLGYESKYQLGTAYNAIQMLSKYLN